MAKFDSLTDTQFEQIINSCSTGKELGEKLGYINTISSNLKAKLLKRCDDLGIKGLEIVSIIPIQNKTKKEVFDTNKTGQSARSSIRRDAYNVFMKNNSDAKCKVCGYNKHVEVAHIKAVSEFSDDTLISEINDHGEYDNGLLKL